MFRTKPTRTDKLKAQVVEAREHAATTAGELGHTAGERLAVMREQAAPRASEAADRAKEAWEDARVKAAPVAADLADRARPKVEAAQSTLVESVLPKVGAAIGVASAALAQGADEARERMREAEPHVQQARESAKVRGDRVRDAYRVLSGEAVAKPVKRGRKKWLFLIGFAAAAVAAVAAYRRRQADDLWATPVGGTMGGRTDEATGTPGFDTSSSRTEKTTEKVEHAKEAVTDAAATAKEKATDLAAKGKAAVTDAKDSADERVSKSEMEQTSIAADDALDESPGEGQVTAVDSTLGSDAIDASAGTLPSESVKPKRRRKA